MERMLESQAGKAYSRDRLKVRHTCNDDILPFIKKTTIIEKNKKAKTEKNS